MKIKCFLIFFSLLAYIAHYLQIKIIFCLKITLTTNSGLSFYEANNTQGSWDGTKHF